MALGIDGLRIGTWTHPHVPTGCTVVLPPDGTLGAIAVRGQSPGTREAAALGPAARPGAPTSSTTGVSMIALMTAWIVVAVMGGVLRRRLVMT